MCMWNHDTCEDLSRWQALDLVSIADRLEIFFCCLCKKVYGRSARDWCMIFTVLNFFVVRLNRKTFLHVIDTDIVSVTV